MRSYFGLVGNGETSALVGPDLSISWLCIPRCDQTPVFAGALDPSRGGRLGLLLLDASGSPVPLTPVRQSYAGDTAVLRTTAAGAGWQVEAVDYMPWGSHSLIREVQLTNTGSAPNDALLQAVVEPVRSDAFPLQIWTESGETFIQSEAGTLLVACPPGQPGLVPAGATATVRITLAYGTDPTAAHSALVDAELDSATMTERFWTRWLAHAAAPATLDGAWLRAYRRSLITMKLLSYEQSGALLAAPTASFPAVPGGGDNWDYRFIWLRDGYYTAMSLDAAGLHEEAGRFYDFCFSVQGADGHWRQPLYTVTGEDPHEFVAADLCGPGGEAPIRFGNAASGQLQLDNEGNIIHGLWFHYRTSGDRIVLERHWDGVVRACRWTAANWRRKESGIWELRAYQAHWVHGKAMCYAALDAGARIAEALGQAPEAAEWRRIAAEIRHDVLERGWDPERQAYLRHYAEPDRRPCVDISVLALVFYGLLPPDDPRILATVALMERPQQDGGLFLYEGFCRYDYAAVPFYLPTLWLARYYLMAGRRPDAEKLIRTCLECATDLDLMAEHFDGRDHSQWGNFPQAFSHEELARLLLEWAQGWSFHQWDCSIAGTSAQGA